MKKTFLTLLLMTATSFVTFSQRVGINDDGSNPDNSAILDVKSTVKGLLTPRMSKIQRDAITTPATGLLIYQTDNTPAYYYYNGSSWTILGGTNIWNKIGSTNNIYYKGTSDTLVTFNYLDGFRNGLKIYSPTNDKSVQFTIDRGYNVAAINTNAATTELWANSGKQMAISMGKIDCQTNNIITTGSLGIGTSSPVSSLSIGNSSQFQINSSGNIVKLNNVTTNFPSSNTSGILTNNGSGVLSWAAQTNGNSKCMLTSDGGFAIFVHNYGVSILRKGTIVEAGTTNTNSIKIAVNSSLDAFGIMVSDCAAGADGWMVVTGLTYVLVDNNVNPGDDIETNSTSGIGHSQGVSHVSSKGIGRAMTLSTGGTPTIPALVLCNISIKNR